MTSTVLVSRPNTRARALARTAAFASLTRGAVGVLAPGAVAAVLGKGISSRRVAVCGAAEVAAGLSILGSSRPVTGMWGRVACDGAEIAALLPALRRDNPQRLAAGAALAFLAATAAFHTYVALQGDEEEVHEEIR